MQSALPIRDKVSSKAAVSSRPPCLGCRPRSRAVGWAPSPSPRHHRELRTVIIGVSSFEGLIARLSWSIPANSVFPRRLGHLHDTHFGKSTAPPQEKLARCGISHHPPDPITAAAAQPPTPTPQTKRRAKKSQLAPLKRPCISSALGTVQKIESKQSSMRLFPQPPCMAMSLAALPDWPLFSTPPFPVPGAEPPSHVSRRPDSEIFACGWQDGVCVLSSSNPKS